MRLTVTKTLSLFAVLAAIATGQTQVDLRTQSKSVDFTSAPSTKPFAAGPALPATCGVGQMFFLTSAPIAQNVYGCSTANTWTLQSGGPTSPTTIDSSGTFVGTRGVLDLSAGPGILWSVSDTGTEISVESMLDTSYAETRAGDQSGANLLCSSSSAANPGIAYVCSMNPTLTAYSPGMVLHWTPDVDAVGGAGTSLNVDNLGSAPVDKADGVTHPASTDVVAGELYQLWYDGAVFRIMSGGGSGGGATGPAGPQGPAGPAGSVALIANGTAALGTSAVPSGACATAVTSAAVGAAATDNIEADFNADPTSTTGYSPSPAGMLTIIKYPTANAVNFKVCNNTGSSVTPGAITLNWRVMR